MTGPSCYDIITFSAECGGSAQSLERVDSLNVPYTTHLYCSYDSSDYPKDNIPTTPWKPKAV